MLKSRCDMEPQKHRVNSDLGELLALLWLLGECLSVWSSQSAGRSVWVSPAALAAGPVGLVDVTTATGRLPFHKKKLLFHSDERLCLFLICCSASRRWTRWPGASTVSSRPTPSVAPSAGWWVYIHLRFKRDGSFHRPPPPVETPPPCWVRVWQSVFTCKRLFVSCRANLTTPSWGWPRTTASSPSKASS